MLRRVVRRISSSSSSSSSFSRAMEVERAPNFVPLILSTRHRVVPPPPSISANVIPSISTHMTPSVAPIVLPSAISTPSPPPLPDQLPAPAVDHVTATPPQPPIHHFTLHGIKQSEDDDTSYNRPSPLRLGIILSSVDSHLPPSHPNNYSNVCESLIQTHQQWASNLSSTVSVTISNGSYSVDELSSFDFLIDLSQSQDDHTWIKVPGACTEKHLLFGSVIPTFSNNSSAQQQRRYRRTINLILDPLFELSHAQSPDAYVAKRGGVGMSIKIPAQISEEHVVDLIHILSLRFTWAAHVLDPVKSSLWRAMDVTDDWERFVPVFYQRFTPFRVSPTLVSGQSREFASLVNPTTQVKRDDALATNATFIKSDSCTLGYSSSDSTPSTPYFRVASPVSMPWDQLRTRQLVRTEEDDLFEEEENQSFKLVKWTQDAIRSNRLFLASLYGDAVVNKAHQMPLYGAHELEHNISGLSPTVHLTSPRMLTKMHPSDVDPNNTRNKFIMLDDNGKKMIHWTMIWKLYHSTVLAQIDPTAVSALRRELLVASGMNSYTIIYPSLERHGLHELMGRAPFFSPRLLVQINETSSVTTTERIKQVVHDYLRQISNTLHDDNVNIEMTEQPVNATTCIRLFGGDRELVGRMYLTIRRKLIMQMNKEVSDVVSLQECHPTFDKNGFMTQSKGRYEVVDFSSLSFEEQEEEEEEVVVERNEEVMMAVTDHGTEEFQPQVQVQNNQVDVMATRHAELPMYDMNEDRHMMLEELLHEFNPLQQDTIRTDPYSALCSVLQLYGGVTTLTGKQESSY